MRVGFIVLGVLLAGCTTEGLVKTAYPDRKAFRFENADGSEIMTYLCALGESEAETQTRAGQAHRFFEGRINAMAEKFADAIVDGVDTGTTPDFQRLSAELEQKAEQAALATEDRYKCLFVDAEDL